MDAEYTFEMVEKVAKVCEDAGNATPHRRAAAGSYAFFLFTVLAKARGAWRSKLARREGEEADKGGKREREGEGAARQTKRGKVDKERRRGESNGGLADETAVQLEIGEASAAGAGVPSTAPSGEAELAVTNVESDQHFLRQLMQFQAGPSGVQTAIVHDPLASSNQQPIQSSQQQQHLAGFTPNSATLPMLDTNVVAPHGFGASGGIGGDAGVAVDGAAGMDIDWDFGMLDGFLGESLFSDMSFVSASATPANMNALNGG